MRKGPYSLLSERFRELVDKFEEKLKNEGYKPTSIASYRRQAAKYLLFCQKNNLEPFQEKSLELYKENLPPSSTNSTRAAFFVKKMASRSGDSLAVGKLMLEVEKIARELSALKDEIGEIKKRESLSSELHRAEKVLSVLIGKPVKVKTLNGDLYKGELKFTDGKFLYLYIFEGNGKGHQFPKQKKKLLWGVRDEESCTPVIKVLPTDVIEYIEVSSDLLGF